MAAPRLYTDAQRAVIYDLHRQGLSSREIAERCAAGLASVERFKIPARSVREIVKQMADERGAKRVDSLERITLHECRHTFASLMIAAGVNAKALSTYMGHANISITLDRYGHLMPGNEDEAAGLLDAYLVAQQERVDERARAATGEPTGEPEPIEAAEPL
jgi:integrase